MPDDSRSFDAGWKTNPNSTSSKGKDKKNKKRIKAKQKKKTKSVTLDRRSLVTTTTAAAKATSSNATTAPAALPISSRLSRRLIRSYHVLQKKSLTSDDPDAAAAAAAELERLGGIEAYQRASVSGQSKARGGDTSRMLVRWFREASEPLLPVAGSSREHQQQNHNPHRSGRPRPRRRLLEVGCLSPDNELSAFFDEKSMIDLNSRHPDIRACDFMEMDVDGSYDMISLSLVLNYVPAPAGRGEMLKRTTKFLLRRQSMGESESEEGSRSSSHDYFFPSLFLVLPAPCVSNSRYLTDALLTKIMGSLGYSLLQHKVTSKLAYYLWRYEGSSRTHALASKFPKKEVNPGPGRNNFAIVL